MSLLLKTISIIAPARCLVCGREGQDLCDLCLDGLPQQLPSRCWRCQKLSLGSKTCSNCRRAAPLSSVWVASEYTGEIKRAIKALKFKRQRGLARPLSKLLAGNLPFFKRPPIIVHVPTATIRRRVRGYDHGELLAKELAKLTGWPHVAVIRRQTQTRQVGARRTDRLKQLEDAFRVIRTEYVSNQDILLIDDVATTGATLSVCARALKGAGAKSVSAAVLAQKS